MIFYLLQSVLRSNIKPTSCLKNYSFFFKNWIVIYFLSNLCSINHTAHIKITRFFFFNSLSTEVIKPRLIFFNSKFNKGIKPAEFVNTLYLKKYIFFKNISKLNFSYNNIIVFNKNLVFNVYFLLFAKGKKKTLFKLTSFFKLVFYKNLLKKIKNLKLKKRKKSLLFFFRKKKYFFSLNLKKKKQLKKWKKIKFFLKKPKLYKYTLGGFNKKLRKNIIDHLNLNLKKKRFFVKRKSLENSTISYNFNLSSFEVLTKSNQIKIFKNLQFLKNRYFPKLLLAFCSNFFETLTKQKFFISVVTNSKPLFFERLLINYFFRKFFIFQRQFKSVLHLKEFIHIIILTFKYKDLYFLKNWMINFLEKINLKKHKIFLRLLKNVSLAILFNASYFFDVKGFFFDIRGKVGVAGNAKKRHFSIKYKSYGFTKIKLRAEQVKFVLRTNTGVLGSTLLLTY